MFKGKKGPLLLLSLLALALFFILGMQYGKQVERADKTIRYILSITPSVAPTADTTESLHFKTYIDEICNISFLYPGNLAVIDSASSEAELQDSTTSQRIFVSCSDNPSIELSGASSEAILDTVTASKYEDIERQFTQYRITDEQDVYYAEVSTELGPLFESSFKILE